MRKKTKIKHFQLTDIVPVLENIGKACAVTWIAIALICGMSMVEYQAVVNCYIQEDTMFSIRENEPLSLRFDVMGESLIMDYSILNIAAETGQKYFYLIPAPFRFVRQLYLYVQDEYIKMQEAQRLREFAKNI